MSQTDIITISLPKPFAKKVDQAAKSKSMTRSEYMRDVIRRDIAFRQLDELRQETMRRAPAAGIRTLDDAVKAVREIRDTKG